MLKEDFLENYLQYRLEEAIAQEAIPSPEERPYDNFYAAREIFKELKSDAILDEDNIDALCFKAVATYYLGMNYYETEEISQARKEFD